MKKLIALLVLSVFITGFSAYKLAEYFQAESDVLQASIINEVKDAIDEGVVESQEIAHAIPSYEKNLYYRDDLRIDLPEEYEVIAREVLAQMPESQIFSLKKVVADYDQKARRGLASFKSMYIGVNNIDSAEEFKRVFIHELGHVVDLGALQPNVTAEKSEFRDGSNTMYNTDASLDFYRLCWADEHTQNGNCREQDFVSGYASTDAFEDFAESYLLFVENNETFEDMAGESDVIQAKYDFFAEQVFNNKFEKTGGFDLDPEERPWDLTVLTQ